MRSCPLAFRVVVAVSVLAAAGCLPRPIAPGSDEVALTLVADGFTAPVALVVPDDGTGRLFVVDQIGLIVIVEPAAGKRATPFLDLRDRVVDLSPGYDERGLLGIAFHPQYKHNRRFFVFYSAPPGPDTPQGFDSDVRISEFRAPAGDIHTADAASERVILSVPQPQANHNGGQLAFGPDGFLYVGLGDGGAANDVGFGHTPFLGNAQDRTTLLGKLLRIDVDRGDPYGIPADNPFAGLAATRGEIWALGLRNPWRFSFDTGGARRLFLADVGQNLFEEVNIITRGGNYGWNVREATACFDPQAPTSPLAECPAADDNGRPLSDPILTIPHTDSQGLLQSTAVIGGYVYRGADAPAFAGQYLFGDFSAVPGLPDGRLFAARQESGGAWTYRELAVAGEAGGRLRRFVLAFGQDQAGEVYVLTSDNAGPSGATGKVFRIAPTE
jgi:glucose/arabinose dehydrogenase